MFQIGALVKHESNPCKKKKKKKKPQIVRVDKRSNLTDAVCLQVHSDCESCGDNGCDSNKISANQ